MAAEREANACRPSHGGSANWACAHRHGRWLRWSTALQAMRGVELVTAVVVLAEIGDLSRFQSPRELMAYLGLVPSEASTGDSVKRGPITKAGNKRARRALVEAAWSYRHPPRVGRDLQVRVAAAPKVAREIAWKAQTRLSSRYRQLARKGKRSTVSTTAIAREMTGFIWDICRQVMPGGVQSVTAERAKRAVDRSSNAGARPAHSPASAINP